LAVAACKVIVIYADAIRHAFLLPQRIAAIQRSDKPISQPSLSQSDPKTLQMIKKSPELGILLFKAPR
jgi:hypothetical protein